jgi:hypothetical protein
MTMFALILEVSDRHLIDLILGCGFGSIIALILIKIDCRRRPRRRPDEEETVPIIDTDLSRHADTLGDPDLYFVDEHDHVWRVVEHATGLVAGVLRPDGTLAPFRPTPDPAAPAVVAALDFQADRSQFHA